MVRVAGSLVTNQVRAYDLLRMFSRNGNPTPLGQAFAEYGRIDKTSTCSASSTRSTTPTTGA
jgi:TnpA family transposase